VKELVWGFVSQAKEHHPDKALAHLTTTTASSISPTTDWVSQHPADGYSGRVWDLATTSIEDVTARTSTNIGSDNTTTDSPIIDLVTEQIEKVKVTLWQATNMIDIVRTTASTLAKEQMSGVTDANGTNSPSTALSASTPISSTRKDYRMFGVQVTVSMEDLHWSYYLLIGFACLALLVCLAQGSTCLYISLVGRQRNQSHLKEVIVCGKSSRKSLES